MQSVFKKFMIRIGAIVVIVAGVAILYGQFAPARLVQRSQIWPSTRGVITTFQTHCRDRPGGGCSVRLRYQYQVAGQQLENGRITFNDDNLDTWDDVRTYRARYAVEKTVAVFYDPREPTSAVLERTAFWSLRYLFAGAACVFVGALMLLPRAWIYRLGGAPPDVAGS